MKAKAKNCSEVIEHDSSSKSALKSQRNKHNSGNSLEPCEKHKFREKM